LDCEGCREEDKRGTRFQWGGGVKILGFLFLEAGSEGGVLDWERFCGVVELERDEARERERRVVGAGSFEGGMSSVF
jgi:hypothetical protein